MKKSTQRIAAWLLAAGMVAGTFAQPLAVYAEAAPVAAAADTADIITADADVTLATPAPAESAPEEDESSAAADTADNTPTPEPTPTPESTAAPEAASDPESTAAPQESPAPEDTAAPEEAPAAAADDTDTAEDTGVADEEQSTGFAPEDLESCLAMLASSQLMLDENSIEPEVKEETMALAADITQNEETTLQALVNAAVWQADLNGQTEVVVNVPENTAYTGTLVIPDATIIGTGENGEYNVNYNDKIITLNMHGSTLTVPADAAVGVAVFGTLTIQGGTIQAAEDCTATRGVQVQVGSSLTLDNTAVNGFTYAGPGAGVYVKGTASVDEKGQYDAVLNDNDEPVTNPDGTVQFKKLQRENGAGMETSFSMVNGASINSCHSDGNGAALYVHNAAQLALVNAAFTNNDAGSNGGAVYLGSGVQLSLGENIRFDGNHATKDGGALYLDNQYTIRVKDTAPLVQVPVTIDGTVFTNNSTDALGGAIAMSGSFDGFAENTIKNAKFGTTAGDDTEAAPADGNTANRGGAIAFNSYITDNTLQSCSFTGNSAVHGGAVYYPNRLVKAGSFNPAYRVENCTFTQNKAEDGSITSNQGGAVLVQINPDSALNNIQTASLYVSGSSFTGNTAGGYGGAVSTMREGNGPANGRIYLNFDGNTFENNEVTTYVNEWRGGGAVYLSSYAWADFTANTFTGNHSAYRGGAVMAYGDNLFKDRTITFGALQADGTADPAKANSFTGNNAYNQGGAVWFGVAYPGDNTNGIYSSLHIYGDTYTENTTDWSMGGAVYANSGINRDDTGLTVVGATFDGNRALHTAGGGAVYTYGITASYSGCSFTNNSTERSNGGALYVEYTKQFDLKECAFTGNTADSEKKGSGWGGAVFINSIPTVKEAHGTWQNVTFDGNTANNSGGAVAANSNVNMTLDIGGITARNNTAAGHGGAFRFYMGNISMTDVVFEGNNSNAAGGAIFFETPTSLANLTIRGSSRFINNTAYNNGGAICINGTQNTHTDENGKKVYYHGSLTMTGTEDERIVFSGNTSRTGGGGAISIGSNIYSELGYIDVHDNTSKTNGGGIWCGAIGSQVNIADSKIHDNTAAGSGGGMFVNGYMGVDSYKDENNTTIYTRLGDPAEITVQSCEITGNSSTATSGEFGAGGISVGSDLRNVSSLYGESFGTFKLVDTKVADNTAVRNGGALAVGSNWSISISGGSISNNTTQMDGGALYTYSNTTIQDKTVIEGNTAGTNGGAFRVLNTAAYLPDTLTTVDCEIKNNIAKNGGIAYVSARAGFAMGKNTAVDSNQGVGDVCTEKSAGTVTLPAANELPGVYDAWLMDNTTTLTEAVENDNAAAHTYTLQGAAHYVARLNGGVLGIGSEKFTTLQAALDAAKEKDATASIDLLADVGEQAAADTVHNPITLNLNGYTLTGKITVSNGSNTNAFTLTDIPGTADYKKDSTGGVLTGSDYGISLKDGKNKSCNTLVVTGKTLTIKNLQYAIYGNSYADVTVKDAAFTGIKSSGNSGCIWLQYNYNRVQLENVTITDIAGYSIYMNGGNNNVTLTDCRIYNNTGLGGRIYANNGGTTLTFVGGEYHDNTSTGNGGVVRANSGSTVIVNGGAFYNNKAPSGGAIYMDGYGNITINDGDFHDNTSTGNGGAITAGNVNAGGYSVTLTINGGKFYHNTAAGNGGAVYMSNGGGTGTLNMTGGEIYENTAGKGGAVYINGKAAVTLSKGEESAVGGIIRDNTANELASNLYLGGADSTLTVEADTLLYGGTVSGDVLLAQGGSVKLADTQTLHTEGIEEAEQLVWLKNDAETGDPAVTEEAAAQTIYTLCKDGQNTGTYAARIGDTRYFSISQALNALEAADTAENPDTNETTIYLLRDQTEKFTVVLTSHSAVLNLNGYTLTGNITVNDLNKNGTTFTLCNAAGEGDYNPQPGGGVFTGNGTGITAAAQTNADDHTTIKLQDVTLTGFTDRAVYLNNNVNLAAQNTVFSGNSCTNGNSRGAAIHFGGTGTLAANGCTFSGNTNATGGGGAVFMNNGSCKAVITNCTFTNNKTASGGGAMYLCGHALNLTGNTFSGNTTNGSGGGAVYMAIGTNAEKADEAGLYDAVLTDNRFENNAVTNASGGAVFMTNSSGNTLYTSCLAGNSFVNNRSNTANGGAVYSKAGNLTLGSGNLFEENTTYGSGSALYMETGSLTSLHAEGVKYDTIFKNNTVGYGNYNGGSGALLMNGSYNADLGYMLFDGNIGTYSNSTSAIYFSSAANSTGEEKLRQIDHCDFVNNESSAYTVYAAGTNARSFPLKITDCTFDHNTARADNDGYAVLAADYGNVLQIENTSFTNTQGKGRVIYTRGGGSLAADGTVEPAVCTFTNVQITDNTQGNYAPVLLSGYNNSNSDNDLRYSIQGQSVWKDCTITGNKSNLSNWNSAGAMQIYKQLVTMENCTISDNTGASGAVLVYGNLTHVGRGEQKEATLTMTGCTVSGNSGTNAGGIWLSGGQSYRATLNLTDCTISNNSASNGCGGGVRIGSNDWGSADALAVLNAENTTLTGNSAVYGGGLFAGAYDMPDGTSRIRLTDCTISGNTADYGGGIYVKRYLKPEKRGIYWYPEYCQNNASASNTLQLVGGTVSDNTARLYGGGICTDINRCDSTYNSLTVNAPDTLIDNNRAQLGQDVYAYKATPDTILHLAKASAITGQPNGRWLNENTNEVLKDEPIDYEPIQRTYPLTMSVPKTETEVARIVLPDGTEYKTYDSLQAAMDDARALLAENPDQSLTVELLKDTNSSTIVSSGTNVTLDLADHSIKGIGGSPALTVESSNVAIKNGTISGTATDGGALLLRNNANVTLTGTQLANCRAAYRGGAVCIESGSSFTLGSGSSITGSQAGFGGAVYLADGSFTQTEGAEISGCSVFENPAYSGTGYGSAVYIAKGTYNLKGGTITGNTAPRYGTVYVSANAGAEFNMSGGEITANKSQRAAVYQNGGTVTLAGGSITNNTATEMGGGVYQNGGTSLVRGDDFTISGNTAPNGGGWYMNGGSSLMRGGSIANNKATTNGGGIYQAGGSLVVNGGEITANNAADGGGLCHTGGTFDFEGGALYGNISTKDGTGNDVYSTRENGRLDLIAAAAMNNSKYNVWRDDYYPYTFTTGYHNVSNKIATKDGSEPGGKYLTSTIPNVNNVKLTADYYGSSSIEIESNDMYVETMKITTQDSGNGINDHYDAEDGLITARDVLEGKAAVEGVQRVTQSDTAYPLDYTKAGTAQTEKYLTVTYTDGREEKVRPETPLAWTAGTDSSKDNALIRSFSTANYIVALGTRSEAMQQKLVGATQRLWMRIKVPCQSGEILMSGNGDVFKSSFNYYDPTEGCQILEGYQDHVITENEAGGVVNMTMQFSITVGAMHNGDTVSPTIEAWFDNSSYTGYETDTNPYSDRIVLDANTMRVSAAPSYNLAVDNQKDLHYVGYFDMESKTEITETQYKTMLDEGKDVVYGMVAGYGMSLQLRNQDTGKGLRGIEIPQDDITFTMALNGGLYFEGKQVCDRDTGSPVSVNPRLWAYKPNDSATISGYDTRDNTAGVNMDWNDEDDDNRNTHYDPYIDLNVTGTHSGGTWMVTDAEEDDTLNRGDGTSVQQSKLTFHVSGYSMKPAGNYNAQSYQFSTGYLQVIIPLEMDKYDFSADGNYEGFLQADMHVVAGDMTLDTDADLHGKDAELSDKINSYFAYTDEDTLRQFAKNEATYDDNYNNSATLGMNIIRSYGAGSGTYIIKTSYWLGSDGSTVLNDAKDVSVGSNVTGVGSRLYMGGRLYYNSEKVTPANAQDKFIYDPQVDQQDEYYYLTAYDVLMKFDPDAMRPVTYQVDGREQPIYRMNQNDVAAKLNGVVRMALSDNGYSEWDTTKKLTQSYELTVLYAAKADETPIGNGNAGNGWAYASWSKEDTQLDDSQPLWNMTPSTRDDGGTADMDNYSFYTTTLNSDETTKEVNGLVYYSTLTELEAAGKTCVAVLYQIRNCCVRNGRSVSIGHMMQVSDDTAKIGRSYATTMDVRGWTTYRPFYRSALTTGSNAGWTRLQDENGVELTKRSDLLYQDLIEGNGEQAAEPAGHILTSKKNAGIQWNIGGPSIRRPATGNYYKKTQYSNGYEVGGSHSGYLYGNTVLIATQNTSVKITTTDISSGNIRQTDYQLDNGQRTVSVEVTPKITMQSNVKTDLDVFDGLTQTDIALDVTLPQDLTLQEGSLSFDYSHSGYNRSDLTWNVAYQYWDEETETWFDFDFERDYTQNYAQRRTRLHLTTTITDVKKTLPLITFKAGIGYPSDPALDIAGENGEDGAWYKTMRINAEIHSAYEEEGVNASLGRTDYTEIKVLRNSKTVVNKTARHTLVEIGDTLEYDLSYVKQGGVVSNLELCDILPYNSKEFHGAYGLKSVTVTVEQEEGNTWSLQDKVAVQYGNTKTISRDAKTGELNRKQTMQNAAGNGTALHSDSKTAIDNSITFTPQTMPIHTASGDSDLGSLYILLRDLPEATVKVHVVLAVAQDQDGTNTLLTDTDKKTIQQSGDVYSNSYIACAGRAEGSLVSSPTASIKVRSRSISGLVWLDQNHDGIYTTRLNDAGKNVGSDKTLAGIVVTLVEKAGGAGEEPVYTDQDGNTYYSVTDTLGNTVQPFTTEADGHYSFENLKQGSYYVLFADSEKGYQMQDGSKPILAFGKLSVTKRDVEKDTSNKATAQYAAESTDLQAAMSGELTLGDAVLTGRDDKTNINAGFYYTELRLAKNWENLPDADAARDASVEMTLAARQGDALLDEATYTLSDAGISKPTQAEDGEHSYFRELVGDGAEVLDDTAAQRHLRWQTVQGLPLQAENANGPIEYILAKEEVRAPQGSWAGSASFVQQQTEEAVSSGSDSDNSVIATRIVAINTARTYDVMIHKLSDVEDKELDGAEFTATLQTEGILHKLFGQPVKITSQPTIQRTDEASESCYRLADLTAGSYTLTETKAPAGYSKDPVQYTLTIMDCDEAGNHVKPTITLWDDKGNLLYTAEMADTATGINQVTVTQGEGFASSAATARLTDGSCLETMPEADQQPSNLPIRAQIDLEITDHYLFDLPFTGGSGMDRYKLQGAMVMGLAAIAFVTLARRRKKRHG